MFLNLKPSTDFILSIWTGETMEIIPNVPLEENQGLKLIYISTENGLYL